LLFTYYFWYSGYLIYLTGATSIFLLIILVDGCLGPLLTLAVFDIEKPKHVIKRDLLIIFFIQVSALCYGTFALFSGRPVFSVFAVDRFELVQANDIPLEMLRDANNDFSELPLSGVRWVYAELPDEIEERNQILFNGIEYGVDLAQSPKYYNSISVGMDQIRERLLPISVILTEGRNIEEMTEFKIGDYGFLPITGRKRDMIVIISKANLDDRRIVNYDPWGTAQ